MFLKIFEPIFAALMKNVKLTLLAILLAVLISWGISGEYRVKAAKDDCAEERKADKALNAAQAEELKDMRTRLFDAFMLQQIQREATNANDSIARKATERALNTIQP